MNGAIEDTLHGVLKARRELKVDDLFAPLVQRGENRSGFGLGLAIARQAVEAQGGIIKVRDVPGDGCVFSIELPQPAADGNQDPPSRIEA